MSGINVSAIERDLANMWREEAVGDDEERAVTRARVLTLLVYCENESAGPELADTITSVTEQHPGRTLVMTVDPQASTSSASASVTASCHIQGPRSKQLSSELVNFHASGEAVKELPSVIAQLLAPDVPVFLWWRSAQEVDDYNLTHLVPMADRVILDSSRSLTPREDAARLAGLLRDHPSLAGVTDFTWQRLTPWRETIASFFDPSDHRPYLGRIDRVTVQYMPSERSSDISARALMLVSWLAERLGWKLDADASSTDGDENRFSFHAGDREVTVRFIAVQRPGLEGLISSVQLDATAEPAATFSVTRAERNRLASEVVIGGRQQSSRVTAYHPRTESQLLATELGIVGRDRLYEAAVTVAGEMGAVKAG